MEEFDIGDFELDEEIEIEDFELDVIKIEPIYEELIITPALEVQTKEGSFNKVTVEAIETEELNIVPSKDEQVKEGIYNKVKVAGDEDLIPDNIKKGVNIFGVEGTLDGIDTSDGTATANDIIEGKVAYAKNERIVGTLKNENNAKIDVSGVTTINYSTLGQNISNIDIDVSDATNLASMCEYNRKLKTIQITNTNKATTFLSMFYECRNVETIPELDASNVRNINSMLAYCYALKDFGGLKNLGKAYTQKTANYNNYAHRLNHCEKLTYESLMNIINNLYDLNLTYDVNNGGTLYTQILQLGSTNKAKLTPEEINLAVKKGWTVS